MKWWTGLKGAARYVAARAAGDVASPEQERDRAATCAACPNLVRREAVALWGFQAMPVLFFCGEPLTETAKTCGCITLAQAKPGAVLTVNGVPVEAAGKAD